MVYFHGCVLFIVLASLCQSIFDPNCGESKHYQIWCTPALVLVAIKIRRQFILFVSVISP